MTWLRIQFSTLSLLGKLLAIGLGILAAAWIAGKVGLNSVGRELGQAAIWVLSVWAAIQFGRVLWGLVRSR